MPPTKKTFRKTLRRKPWNKRKWGRKVSSTLVNRALHPIPSRYITKMKYCDNFTMPTALSGLNTYRFNLNSIFDPNRTGVGHQPYGHDTLQTMYNRYRVISCSYVISVVANATINCAVLPANEEISPSAMYEVKESPRCKFIVQNPGGTIKTLKGKVYLPSLVGRTKAQYMADDRYQAAYGASPSELAILNLFTQQINDGTTDQLPQITVTLNYLVESFDIKQLGVS